MLNQSLAAEPIFLKYKRLVQSKLKTDNSKKKMFVYFLSIQIQYVSATFSESTTQIDLMNVVSSASPVQNNSL